MSLLDYEVQPHVPGTALARLVRDYKALTTNLDMLEKRRKEVRDRLSTIVVESGEEDEKGHIVLALPEKIDGISSLMRQRRVKRTLDEHVAERVISQAHLIDRCYRMVPVLDEDVVMQARFEGLLTDADIDSMFPTTVTWAFVTVKA